MGRKNFPQNFFLFLILISVLSNCLIATVLLFKYNPFILKDKEWETQAHIVVQEEFPHQSSLSSLPTVDSINSRVKSIDELALYTMDILETVNVPENDIIDIVGRYKGIKNAPVKKMSLPSIRMEGDREKFWVLNVDTNSYRRIDATLVAQTEHLNFWVEDGVNYQYQQVKELVNIFESQIYPTNREYFGSEWTPGVDNDDRLVILFARELGGAAGYHSSKDAFINQIDPYSNEAEMFYLSADYLRLNDPYTYGVLAHEFQHMIHWNTDRNETAWLNEGFSELAVEINRFPVSGFDYYFASNPDIQLNFWPGNEQGDSRPHYGASNLFVRYFMDRFGKESIKELAAHPENGLKSIDEVLGKLQEDRSQDSSNISAEDVFQDWSIANILKDGSLENGIYSYQDNSRIPTFNPSDHIICDSDWKEMTVHQFGIDYISVSCDHPFKIDIQSDPTVALLPVEPKSGDHYYWSNYGDESSMQLSRQFDLSDVEGEIWLEYNAWFDIERDYDYVYLTASTDGENWEILNTPACTIENKTGANYSCGYNGRSGEWIRQRVDLSRYAGEKVILMFEYITDAAVNGDGFVIDDISISVIDYFTDFEQDGGGWEAKGFVRVTNYLPQKLAVSIINTNPNPYVEKYQITSTSNFNFEFKNPAGLDSPIIVISGLTRFTHQTATYRVLVTRLND